MTVSLLLALAAAGWAAVSGPAHETAEDKARTVPGAASKGVSACHEDIERFCPKVKPGEGRLGACLKKNAKRLSKPCGRWLRHGGAAHVDQAYRELDKAPAQAPAQAPGPAKPPAPKP